MSSDPTLHCQVSEEIPMLELSLDRYLLECLKDLVKHSSKCKIRPQQRRFFPNVQKN